MRAMILCAGFGTRMQGLTKEYAKPMLPLAGKPLLQHTIEHLVRQGITRIGINLHYKADQITDYFGDGSQFGAHITYIYEGEPSGTAGGAKKLELFLNRSDKFLLLYGDILTDQNYKSLIDFHESRDNALCSVFLHKRSKSNSLVEIDEKGLVTKFLERPDESVFEGREWVWVNSAIYLMNASILDLIPKGEYCDFPKDIFPKIMQTNGLYGLELDAYRCAIDTPERYEQAQAAFTNNQINFSEARI